MVQHDPAVPYQSLSYWLETCGDNLEPRPPLTSDITVDVAILGGGFTGLWTAYYLLAKDPTLKIAILERRISGFGASGRNGGWCTPEFPISPAAAIERFGFELAKNLHEVMNDTVKEVGAIIQREGLDADWAQSGSLQVARGSYGLPELEDTLRVFQSLGLDKHYEMWSPERTNEHVRIAGLQCALYNHDTAVLHPGKLVRQLGRVLENLGVTIYEETQVIDIQEGTSSQPPRLLTHQATVSARLAVVVAGEAYLSELKKLHRDLTPIYSSIVVSEPLTSQQWQSIGWSRREAIASTRLSIDYLQRTADGRILFGGRGEPYHFASKIRDSYDRNERIQSLLQGMVKQWFPSLQDLRFSHYWAGPLGVTRDFMPNFRFNRQTRVASAWGYVGQGVSTSNLAGRILSDLITERSTVLTQLPMVQHKSPKWEPEPFRWLGIRYVQQGLGNVDKRAEQDGLPPRGTSLPERLNRH